MYRCLVGRRMLGEEERGKKWRNYYAVLPRVVGIRIESDTCESLFGFVTCKVNPKQSKGGFWAHVQVLSGLGDSTLTGWRRDPRFASSPCHMGESSGTGKPIVLHFAFSENFRMSYAVS